MVENGDSVMIKGTHKVKMTDHNIDPPTAMFGTVKTGDDLTIHYSIDLKETE